MDLDYIIDCLLGKNVEEERFPRKSEITYSKISLEFAFKKNYFTALMQNGVVDDKEIYLYEDILKILKFQEGFIPVYIIDNYFSINYRMKMSKVKHTFEHWSRDNEDDVKCLDFKDSSTRYIYLIKKTAIKSFLENLVSRGIEGSKLILPEARRSVQDISEDAAVVDDKFLYFNFRGKTRNILIAKKTSKVYLIDKPNVKKFISENCWHKKNISKYLRQSVDSNGNPSNSEGDYFSHYIFILIVSVIQDPLGYIEPEKS